MVNLTTSRHLAMLAHQASSRATVLRSSAIVASDFADIVDNHRHSDRKVSRTKAYRAREQAYFAACRAVNDAAHARWLAFIAS